MDEQNRATVLLSIDKQRCIEKKMSGICKFNHMERNNYYKSESSESLFFFIKFCVLRC